MYIIIVNYVLNDWDFAIYRVYGESEIIVLFHFSSADWFQYNLTASAKIISQGKVGDNWASKKVKAVSIKTEFIQFTRVPE